MNDRARGKFLMLEIFEGRMRASCVFHLLAGGAELEGSCLGHCMGRQRNFDGEVSWCGRSKDCGMLLCMCLLVRVDGRVELPWSSSG